MRSQTILRRSRGLLRTRSTISLYSSSILPRLPRKTAQKRFLPNSREKRLVSTDSQPVETSASSSPSDVPPEEPPAASEVPPESSPDDPDKSKGKRRVISSSSLSLREQDSIELPEGLRILWNPDELPAEPLNPGSVPPPEILEEVLHNLLVTLHPQTQHRAAYPPPLAQSEEPTLALYCPIEGGDYIIDSTVVELARRTDSEVLVLDAVQLAAGEWGYFGSAANSLKLPRNPLHFASSGPSTSSAKSSTTSPYSEDIDDDESEYAPPRQMMFTVLTPSRRGSSTTVIKSKRPAPPSKVKVFFDSLVNLPSSSPGSTPRPRLIYIRDFPTLASTASAWYPYLRDAVSQRRKGPLTRSTSPVSNPITIIFGMSPPLFPSPERPAHSSGSGVLSLLMSRSGSPMFSASNSKPDKPDWSESPAAEQAREKRLQQRLKSWERGENVAMDEHNKYSEDSSDGAGRRRSDVIVLEGSIPSQPGFAMPIPMPTGPLGPIEEVEGPSFYRTSVLVPSVRSTSNERDYRVLRRREINELTMRMAIGQLGGKLSEESVSNKGGFSTPADPLSKDETGQSEGVLEQTSTVDSHTSDEVSSSSSSSPIQASKQASVHKRMWDDTKMWDAWGSQLEPWSTVRDIAHRAIGGVVASREASKRPTLEHTDVSWADVHYAWRAVHGALEYRKTWLKDSVPVMRKPEDESGIQQTVKAGYDEVIENVKNDPDIDPHEQRLLSSIVDAATMTTTFGQVHLPAHTIDSVRSIVSLPLLHPGAFQTGILKQHGMTGCLLFGPPGTGKTLVVRALAKEAGCRMMVISPSDVMDMYVGEGEKLVHAVFSLARKIAPCVIFLDEIDALFSARTSMRQNGSGFAHRGIITEFMQEMDGLKTSRDDNVIVIGATNRPFDLDDAVLRRLPRRLLVDLPGVIERQEIFKILLRDEVLSDDVDIAVLAKQTESFSGSDLKHLCVSAALDAVKEDIKLPWQVSASSSSSNITTRNEVKEGVAVSPEIIPEEIESSSTLNEAQQPEVAKAMSKFTPTDSPSHQRILARRHFDKALKEITPSSSESLGSLADLRKWNEEFGEGRKERRRKSIWGRGQFGFTDKVFAVEEGRVVPTNPAISAPSSDTNSPV
ncbi:hypothetical protein GGU10DRAFT_374546 [Lentinula aff. detonsa]|uniref:AAA+ ATPase domain-containing protein n=1 Tax=Lentinula aff. detonsa TaxID=2804958 RepID=A0AA38NDD6_9AGAR|nr:hypothetical protein GGU10DRAFT_374546 [Lentinula aff. detonsa]